MSRKTAVAAPAQPPFEDILATIDAMDGPTLRSFLGALRERYNLPQPSPVVNLKVSGVGTSTFYGDVLWTRWLEANGWTLS